MIKLFIIFVFFSQDTPDFVSAIALRVDISPQNPDTGPALDAFRPKAWEFFVSFSQILILSTYTYSTLC